MMEDALTKADSSQKDKRQDELLRGSRPVSFLRFFCLFFCSCIVFGVSYLSVFAKAGRWGGLFAPTHNAKFILASWWCFFEEVSRPSVVLCLLSHENRSNAMQFYCVRGYAWVSRVYCIPYVQKGKYKTEGNMSLKETKAISSSSANFVFTRQARTV